MHLVKLKSKKIDRSEYFISQYSIETANYLECIGIYGNAPGDAEYCIKALKNQANNLSKVLFPWHQILNVIDFGFKNDAILPMIKFGSDATEVQSI